MLKKIPYFIVDAFAEEIFEGNPAAVCPLDRWLDDASMQAIASEFNLSETAFFAPEGEGFRIRWFTPRQEVNLCGHATLAAALVHFSEFPLVSKVVFQSKSGVLKVNHGEDDDLILDFPTHPLTEVEMPAALKEVLPNPVYVGEAGNNLFVALMARSDVADFTPETSLLCQVPQSGLVITAPGDESDFVSRYFAPKAGILEDAVTGSTHCALVPYWADRLNKRKLTAHQISQRGGRLSCQYKGERVDIGGQAILFAEGHLYVP
jgi:PhzF family phenazine biosynthesis protein